MKSYSRYWRKNRSRHQPTELALTLRALRKVSGHLGQNIKPVFWKGMAQDDVSCILLDPASFKNRYPLPHNTFDVLVAQVVQEGLSSMEWREWILHQVLKQAGRMDEKTGPFLKPLINAAENIYIDHFTKSKIWNLYLARLWDSKKNSCNRDLSLPPIPESLAGVWQNRALLAEENANLHQYYNDLLTLLDDFTHKIRRITLFTKVAERRLKRKDLYLELWSSVYNTLIQWEEFIFSETATSFNDDSGVKIEENNEDFEEQDSSTENSSDSGLSPEILDEINSIMEQEDADLTEVIAVAIQDPEADLMDTIFKQAVARSDVLPDKSQVARLRKVFKEQDALSRRVKRRRTRKGLLEGKLDARRLFRVPIDGKAFKYRENPAQDYLWQICVVADASSSMNGKIRGTKPWLIAEKSFVSLAEAARGFKNCLDIYAYSEERGVCNLTRLYQNDEMYTVMPAGRTPSGQAIIAAALKMKNKFRHSMIIHITDGAANCGLSLKESVKYCEKNRIQVYTIGCGCNQQSKDFLRECFPAGHLFFMKNIHHLADGFEQLLKQKILQK